jgi:hypothetical protein
MAIKNNVVEYIRSTNRLLLYEYICKYYWYIDLCEYICKYYRYVDLCEYICKYYRYVDLCEYICKYYQYFDFVDETVTWMWKYLPVVLQKKWRKHSMRYVYS